MEYLLGIDIGSSAAKVGLLTLDGIARAVASRSYQTTRTLEFHVEQDPSIWWQAAVEAVREVTCGIGDAEVIGIGSTGHISSLTFVDRSGRPLRPAMGFQDQRAIGEVDDLYARFSRAELARHLGIDLPPAATWPLPRLLWFKKNEPATLDTAYRLIQAKDYVNFQLTGELASDASSNRGIIDLNSGCVPAAVFSGLGLPDSLLPRICRPDEVMGILCHKAAAETGLPAGLPVVAGWNDLNACVLGAGCRQDGDMFNVTGTSEHLGRVASSCDRESTLLSGPFLPGRRLLYGVTSCGGGSLEWYLRAFGMDRDALFELAASVTAGSEWLFFLPYLEGERTPVWDALACGAFVGVRTVHRQEHFARAVLEGVAFGLRQILELGRNAGMGSQPIVISGGTARSHLWNQIKADVFSRNTAVPRNPHTGILGAAILAAVGAGRYESIDSAARGMTKLSEVFVTNPEPRGSMKDTTRTSVSSIPL